MKKLKNFPGTQSPYPSTSFAFSEHDVRLQFIEVQDGHLVDHALSSGRIAFACTSVAPVFQASKASGDVIQTPPLTLPTPGKADVVVCILVRYQK